MTAFLTTAERDQFDLMLEKVLAELPASARELLDEAPLLVEDQPSEELTAQLGVAGPAEICGPFSRIPLAERSALERPAANEVVIYRLGIFRHAGGGQAVPSDELLQTEIRNRLLHELGHHFGLSEAELRRFGYDLT